MRPTIKSLSPAHNHLPQGTPARLPNMKTTTKPSAQSNLTGTLWAHLVWTRQMTRTSIRATLRSTKSGYILKTDCHLPYYL